MKMVMVFPVGGPYVEPMRLSTLASTCFWNNWGVVVDEKLEAMSTWVSVLYFFR